MADTSGEIKGLIIVITFLSTFFLITSMIPSGFLYTTPEGRTVEVPEYFESVDIYSFAETYNFTITQGDELFFEHYFTLGGWNVWFYSDVLTDCMHVEIYDSWWVFRWNFRILEWFNNQGVKVSDENGNIERTVLDVNYDVDNQECKFKLSCTDATFVVYFGFNQTKYSKPSEALLNDDLHVLFCINFDKVNTSFNAWNLIGAILFFQMPNVHPAINALIAIPLWIMIAYLVYVLILKAVPFVGG